MRHGVSGGGGRGARQRRDGREWGEKVSDTKRTAGKEGRQRDGRDAEKRRRDEGRREGWGERRRKGLMFCN